MIDKIEDLYKIYNRAKGKKEMLEESCSKKKKQIMRREKDISRIEEAQKIMQAVANETQKQIIFFIEDIVDTAIESLIKKPYKFKLDFGIKGNRSSAEISVIDSSGEPINPYDAAGGGLCDVISFSLKLAVWNLQRGKKNNTLIFDEPFKFYNYEKDNVVELKNKLSEKLGIQFIYATNDTAYAEEVESVHKVSQDQSGISKVVVI